MILVTGANGQLGKEVCNLFEERSIHYIGTDSEVLDITDNANVEKVLTEINPTYIVHCAAYTAVDNAEDLGKDLAYEVNVTGTKNLTEMAKNIGAKFIYISTDYVFDGEKEDEYFEDDLVNSQSQYGKTKLLGEEIVRNNLQEHYVIRTSWVFGKFGNNFVKTMLRLAKSNNEISVVSDQVGRPTWTRTLAEFILHIIDHIPPYGIYHLSNDGTCSWYDFAKEILKDKDVVVNPITSNQFPQKAKRPKNSVLSLEKAKKNGLRTNSLERSFDNDDGAIRT